MDTTNDYVDFTNHNNNSNNSKDVFHETLIRMALEAAIIITLVVIFMFSCCGLLRKIRESYEQNEAHRIQSLQNPSMFTVVVPNNLTHERHVNASNEETSGGIFPTGPPPYTEYTEPPPKYDDVIKISVFPAMVTTPSNQHPAPVHRPPPAYSV